MKLTHFTKSSGKFWALIWTNKAEIPNVRKQIWTNKAEFKHLCKQVFHVISRIFPPSCNQKCIYEFFRHENSQKNSSKFHSYIKCRLLNPPNSSGCYMSLIDLNCQEQKMCYRDEAKSQILCGIRQFYLLHPLSEFTTSVHIP